MGFKDITAGHKAPHDVNVVIEIPAQDGPVKYEVDKEINMLTVDRIMTTSMRYPANYGYIPRTLSEDGDPVDVLVVTPFPLLACSVIRVRPVGVLQMTDEKGPDAKILAVPITKISKVYENIKTYQDLGQPLLETIVHFFESYKALESGKWVKLKGWEGVAAAEKEILESIKRYVE